MKLVHLSPTVCFMCGVNACYEEMPFCADCFFALHRILSEKCKTCGNTSDLCTCTDTGDIRYIYYFGGADSRKLTYAFKYHSQRNYVRFWAELLVKSCLKGNEGFDGVTYVPRSWLNRHKHGFDQSEKLAIEVAEILNLPLVRTLKRHGFRRQKLLSRSGRIKNARKLYKPKDIPKEKYKKLLLLDDVITTGATILACKDILLERIAKSVVCAVLTKTNIIIN